MTGWRQALLDVAGREPVAMATVLATEGSAPRGAGTRMIVTGTRAFGTIGGGNLEFRAIAQARALLGDPRGSWRIQDYPLGPLLGQCCGGRVRLLVEHVDPARLAWLAEAADHATLVATLTDTAVERRIGHPSEAAAPAAGGERPGLGICFIEPFGDLARPLYLFGAGHVGQAVARHALSLPFRLAWFDTRSGFEAIPGVVLAPEASVEDCVGDAPADAAIVIMTHDHAIDYRLVQAALTRAPVAFTGMIGSRTKGARFMARLERDGVPDAARARLHCPIGIAGVSGKEPDVIAIATLAQLLCLRVPPAKPNACETTP